MLHFTKQHVAILRLHGGGRQSRRLARFAAVALQECADQRGGGGEKLDRVLTKIARARAVHLQHAPRRAFDQHRDIDQRDDAVLLQEARMDEVVLRLEVLDDDRLGGLERAARR